MTFSNADREAGLDRPRRRVFSDEYKVALVEEYYRLTEPGAKGALLRREGLYSSHVVDWRRARDAGTLGGVSDTPRQPAVSGRTGTPATDKPVAGKPKSGSAKQGASRASAEQRENARLARENARLAAELARTKAALEVVGKAHALLELLSEGADTDSTSPE
jgi:transposase